MKIIKKKVYVAMSVDLIHPGHLNIIEHARKLGDVIIGLLTDKAITSYKKPPIMTFKDRQKIVSSLKGVIDVVPQDTLDYQNNLKKIKPDYVVHGDDWRKGPQKNIRKKVIQTLKKWKGKLIEVPYSKEYSSNKINSLISQIGVTPDLRRKSLKKMLLSKNCLRFLDIHNGLSGLIIENTKIQVNGKTEEFDGMWGSSLTNSTAKGKPDIEAVDLTERLQLLNEVLEVTSKPIIYDADTGGKSEHFVFTVKTLERLGVSAVIIEDKIGLKKNSLFSDQSGSKQDSIKDFCKKIELIKKIRKSKDFLIGARIESFILGKGLKDSIKRASAYSEAGADIILIHSKEKTPKEIFSFSKIFRKSKYRKPLVSVPSTYSKTSESMLIQNGFQIVIYANHMLRAAYPAMENAAFSILKNQRSYELENKISSVKKVINLIK